MDRYAQYRIALDERPTGGRFMPYRWWALPDRLDVAWMAYREMLGDYATELANIINDLTHHVARLRAWDVVIAGLDNEERHEISHEFIDVLGTVALGQPYAIKSRFAFAVGHLSHQANQAADGAGWVDDFPVSNLYLNDIEPYCSSWKRYRTFKLRLEPLAGKDFKNATDDFRNVYNHGFSSRFVIGMTGTVSRIVRDGRVGYGFGGNEPLGIADVADLLATERDHCYRTFEAFQALVEEQVAAIIAVETGGQVMSGGRSIPRTQDGS
ncbi:hypothetical protein ASE72_19275 [Sphingomonas sp. Leaf20]|nr:hypothetical protein ASE72_19275 [Sphingomonas sp. Leaf20]